MLLCGSAAEARLTRLVIEQRKGAAGGMEVVNGHFSGELDPKDRHNAIIMDLALAPRNARGMVEYTATFAIAKPVDMKKANGVMMYTVPNRGRGEPEISTDGMVSVVSGWQGDLTPNAGAQTIRVPVAKNADGTPLTGPVSERFINMPAGSKTLSIGTAPYTALFYQRPLTLDTAKASLTKRASHDAPPIPVASDVWAFADCGAVPFPGTPDPSRICAKDGFDPTFEYTLSFTAKDPLVLGIGYAATRDLNSFLRYGAKDETGAANPLAGQIRWAIARGSSQSGNFIRSYINLGFNQDESGRMVWDGVNPHIAARQLALNFRFAVPGGAAGPNEPGSDGVVWWSDYQDKARGRAKAGLLDRCRASNTCPKIMETFGALEFWYLRESPDLVGTDAKADLALPANVRRYFFPGTTHGGGRGGFSAKAAAAPNGCLLAANPNPEADTMRALTADFIEWVTKGAEMPESVYPRLDRAELAAATKAAIHFPAILGAPEPKVNALMDYDFGREFRYGDLSGVITKEPPAVKGVLPTLVPMVDADGIDVGGVRSVLAQAPLGSYLGWNPTASGFDQGKQCTLNGGYIPFAKTKAEREQSSDPRFSLEERYGTHAGYVAAVRAAAEKAVTARFLLAQDAERLIGEADASDVLRTQ